MPNSKQGPTRLPKAHPTNSQQALPNATYVRPPHVTKEGRPTKQFRQKALGTSNQAHVGHGELSDSIAGFGSGKGQRSMEVEQPPIM